MKAFDRIINKFAEFKAESVEKAYPEIEGMHYKTFWNYTKKRHADYREEFSRCVSIERENEKFLELFSKRLYEYTKKALEEYKDELSPEEKNEVLRAYTVLWRKRECHLDISKTEYAELYPHYINKSCDIFVVDKSPMVAGFNLEGIKIANVNYTHLRFLSVNLRGGGVLDDGCISYSKFENCDLSNLQTENDSYIIRCYITRCNLRNANFENTRHNGTHFRYCDLRGAKFNYYDGEVYYKQNHFDESKPSIYDNTTVGFNDMDEEHHINVDDKEQVQEYLQTQRDAKEEIPALLKAALMEADIKVTKPEESLLWQFEIV